MAEKQIQLCRNLWMHSPQNDDKHDKHDKHDKIIAAETYHDVIFVLTADGILGAINSRRGTWYTKENAHDGGQALVAFHHRQEQRGIVSFLCTIGHDEKLQIWQFDHQSFTYQKLVTTKISTGTLGEMHGALNDEMPECVRVTEIFRKEPRQSEKSAWQFWLAVGKAILIYQWNEIHPEYPMELVKKTENLKSTILDIQKNPDGTRWAACCYGGVTIYNHDGIALRHYPYRGSLLQLSWSTDGKILAATTQDKMIHFWRIQYDEMGQLLEELDEGEMAGYPAKIKNLLWNHDGSLLYNDGDAVISVWDFRKGPENTEPAQLVGHNSRCTHLRWIPTTSSLLFCAGAEDGAVLLWQRQGKTNFPVFPKYGFALPTSLQTVLPILLDKKTAIFAADTDGNYGCWIL